MSGKCQFWLHLVLIVSLIFTATVNLSPAYASPTDLRVDPFPIIDISKTPGKTFNININVIEVAGLFGFEFKLRFDTTILDATAIDKGDFFAESIGNQPGGPVIEWHKEINNALGFAWYAVSLGTDSNYFATGIDGSGILATIEFVVEDVGAIPLNLCEDSLIDPDPNDITHETFDGYFSNTGYANPVAEFTFYPSSPILGEPVTFISGSYDIDGIIASWEWELGDGATSSEEIVEHVYTEAGTKIGIHAVTVTLTVIDDEGLESTATETVPLSGHNLAVINTQPNQTYVMQNRTISISVTVKNKGSYSEHFNVTAYYNATPVAPLQTQLLAPKYNKTLTFFWNTSSVAAGTYTISANVTHWPEPYDPEDVETILRDNSLSADGTVTVVLTPVHDIAVIKVTPTPSLVFVGDNVSIDVIVANQGFQQETFNASIYYDANLIEERTDITVPELTSQTLTFTWDTTSVPWGAYYSIKANVSEVVDEINTANNNLTDGTVGVALHNINVLSLSAPTSAVVGTEARIQTAIKNEGRQNATFTASFYYDNTWITNQTVEKLTPSATTSLTVLWDTTGVATGYRIIKVKVPQLEGELVVTENERFQGVSLVPKVHNIAVTSVTANPITVIRGKTVNINVTIQNLGNVDETVNASVYYDTTLIETETGITLTVGENKTQSFTWNTPADIALKTYTIKAEAQILEDLDTTDNTKTTQVTMAIHDIAVVSVTASKDEVAVGESVVVTVVVKNQGSFNESFSVTAKYGENPIETPISVNNLAKEQSETVTFTWNTAGVSPGTYTIKASASTVPDEENTTNNVQEATVTVNESPGGTSLYLIAAGAAIIIIAVAVVAYYLIKKKP